MIYAVISDVHANVEALRTVLEDAAGQGAQETICLGDTVGYGPRPAEAVALVRESCRTVLAGNHDDAVCGRTSAEGFIDLAGEAVARHRDELPAADVKWLRSLPYVYEGDGFIAAHGDFVEPEKFYYIDDEADARANFDRTGAPLMFVGHTHVPKLGLVGSSGTVYVTEAQDFTMEEGKRYIVNPGSVGYPRERAGKCFSSYVLYDSTEKTIVFRYLPFSVSTVLQRGGVRRTRLALWAGMAAIMISALAVPFIVLRQRTEPEKALVATDRHLLVEKAELAVEDGGSVSANLKLDRTSCPLQLSVIFKNESGGNLAEERLTVRRSSARRFPVPQGAKKAVFEIRRNSADDRPKVISFKPEMFTRR